MSTSPQRLRFGPVCSRLLVLGAIVGIVAACSGEVESTAGVSDKSGVVSSGSTQGDMPREGDLQPSTWSSTGNAPSGTQSADSGTAATLEWQPSPDSDVAGYRVYHGAQSRTYVQVKGSGLDAGRATDYTINGLEPGSVVYVAVTAYDVLGNESDYSAELSWIVR